MKALDGPLALAPGSSFRQLVEEQGQGAMEAEPKKVRKLRRKRVPARSLSGHRARHAHVSTDMLHLPVPLT